MRCDAMLCYARLQYNIYEDVTCCDILLPSIYLRPFHSTADTRSHPRITIPPPTIHHVLYLYPSAPPIKAPLLQGNCRTLLLAFLRDGESHSRQTKHTLLALKGVSKIVSACHKTLVRERERVPLSIYLSVCTFVFCLSDWFSVSLIVCVFVCHPICLSRCLDV